MTLIILRSGFAVLVGHFNRGDKKLSLHSRLVLKTTFWLILIGFVFIFLSEFNNPKTLANMDLLTKIQASLFHSVTPRTAGFNTIPMPDLKLSTIFFTILLMFIGASPGSTGGGIKTTTFLSLVLCTISVLKGQDQIVVKERTLPNSIIRKSFVITFLAFFWISTVVLILLLTEKVDFLPVVFETVSAFGTVGLSLGITPSLTFIGKVLIIFTMFFGRVGLLTVMLAIALRNNRTVALSHIKYPEEKIIIG
jgi:trk system potassium uptake protein TrkH